MQAKIRCNSNARATGKLIGNRPKRRTRWTGFFEKQK